MKPEAHPVFDGANLNQIQEDMHVWDLVVDGLLWSSLESRLNTEDLRPYQPSNHLKDDTIYKLDKPKFPEPHPYVCMVYIYI